VHWSGKDRYSLEWINFNAEFFGKRIRRPRLRFEGIKNAQRYGGEHRLRAAEGFD
jgi:hypothetical protein